MRLRFVFGPLALLGVTTCTMNAEPQKIEKPSTSETVAPASVPAKPVFQPLQVDAAVFRASPAGEAKEPQSRFLRLLPTPYFVRGHKDYCDRNPKECTPDFIGDVYLPATPTLFKLLEGVNLQVNTTIKAMSDNEQYGDEYWTVPQGKDGGAPRGDCDDYAMTKRSILEKFIPKSSMSLAFVDIFKDGAYKDSHAILIVHTLGGDLVLDNLSDKLRNPAETGYVFRGMSDPRMQSVWRKVDIPQNDAQAMTREYFVSAFNYEHPRIPSLMDVSKDRYAAFDSKLQWQVATGQRIVTPPPIPFAPNL